MEDRKSKASRADTPGSDSLEELCKRRIDSNLREFIRKMKGKK